MTLPTTLPISAAQILTELGQPTSNVWSTSQSSVYSLAGKTAGAAVSFSDFCNKSSVGAVNVSISPTNPSVFKAATGTGTVSVNASATASGGTGAGFTYSWAYLSGTSFTITAPSSATTGFTKSVANGTDYIGNYRCTVTDNGSHVGTADVSVELGGYPI